MGWGDGEEGKGEDEAEVGVGLVHRQVYRGGLRACVLWCVCVSSGACRIGDASSGVRLPAAPPTKESHTQNVFIHTLFVSRFLNSLNSPPYQTPLTYLRSIHPPPSAVCYIHQG